MTSEGGTVRHAVLVAGMVVLLASCILAQGPDEWNTVQLIPAFYDCRDGRDTHILVTCHAEDSVSYGWVLYNAYGEVLQAWNGSISSGALALLQPRQLLESAPLGFDKWDLAWGVIAVHVLDDPSSEGALSMTAVYYTEGNRELCREHLAPTEYTYVSGTEASKAVFYRATSMIKDVLVVSNGSPDEVEFMLEGFDSSGRPIFSEYGFLSPYESDYYALHELVPDPSSTDYQGILRITADRDAMDLLQLVLEHWLGGALFFNEPIR